MRRISLLLLALSALPGAAVAAEQLDATYRVTSNGPISFSAVALLPLPGGRLVEVVQWPTQSGVCGDTACIGLRFWDANTNLIGTARVKAAALQSVKAATVDGRGRIVVVGSYQGAGADGIDFGVVRFNTDGSDDTSFAGDGGTVVNFGLGQSNDDYPTAVAVDRDDNIVVVGSVQRSTAGDTDMGIARLRASDGALDTTFSGDGKNQVFFDLGPNLRIDQANAVAVRNDRKTVLGGIALDSAISRIRPVMAQLNADGTLDTSFCSPTCSLNAGYDTIHTGRRVYYFGTLSAHSDEILGIDVAGNNDIAIVGHTFADDGSNRRAALARFNAAGSQLSERIEAGLGDNGSFRDVRFADGNGTRMIAAGVSGPGSNYFLAQAFTATSQPDATYGNCLTNNSGFCFIGGSGIGDDGPNEAGQLHLDARGRPLFMGRYFTDGVTRGQILSQRITNTTGPLPDRIFRQGFQ